MATHNYAEVGRHEDELVNGTVLIFDPTWRRPLVPKRCRRRLDGVPYRICGAPAVMELNRGAAGRASWWGYCAEHTYGRVDLNDGVYFVRALREGEA